VGTATAIGVNGIRRLKGLIACLKSADPGAFCGTLAAVKQSVSDDLF
jgi:hypothetical protein